MTPISFKFDRIPAGDAIQIIAEFTNSNILMPDDFREQLISLELELIPAMKAIELIVACVGYDYKIKTLSNNKSLFVVVSSDQKPVDSCSGN